MKPTVPASDTPPAPAPYYFEALTLYAAVAVGTHAALRPARVPS